jgi:phospholipase C
MSYYTRADLPFYYALADAFTIGDAYHCSVLGPTHPNRLMQMSGTIDPAGRAGGPVLVTSQSPDVLFSLRWPTMPEVLEDAGVSWKYYGPPGALYSVETMHVLGITYDTVLPMFAAYQDPSSTLYQRAFEQHYPDDFETDLEQDALPQVSWIATPIGYDEHPPAPPFLGEWFTSQLLARLVRHPRIWAKTVLFVMYDENDGFFDHVAPPSPPPGTANEYVTVQPLPSAAEGVAGPVGLGFRVPLLVVSPFSRGGYVCSDVADHTSQLRFLEERFGVRAPNISAWRRRTVGDLTGTLRPGPPDPSVPKLPATTDDPAAIAAKGCSELDLLEVADDQPAYPQAPVQSMPRQEPGRARRARPHQRH